MDPQKITALRALLAAGAPGRNGNVYGSLCWAPDLDDTDDPELAEAQGRLITAAVNALPELLDEVEQLRAALTAIVSDPFISYDNHYREPGMSDANRQWQIGFTDGVRRCVDIARPAIRAEAKGAE